MIKVGIAGADNPVAGELLRLCLNHPDVEIVSVYAASLAGHSVSSVHHGFIGEENIVFSSNFNATNLDVAFIFTPLYSDSDWAKLMADHQKLRLIIFPGAESIARALPRTPVFGLSEMNRKPLVRGAREAIVPYPISSPMLTALYPFASHLLLQGDLDISVEAPSDVISEGNIKAAEEQIERELAAVQASFLGKVRITAKEISSPRAMKLSVQLPSSLAPEEILKAYDSVYDDHNFTYVVTHPVATAEVENTNKIVISLSKPSESEVRLDIVADPRMRGGAGEAMHIMNLLFGLHEKTGLNLKTSSWQQTGAQNS